MVLLPQDPEAEEGNQADGVFDEPEDDEDIQQIEGDDPYWPFSNASMATFNSLEANWGTKDT